MTPGKLLYACRLNQSVTPIAAEELDVVMFWEQINKASYAWSVVINLGNVLVFNLIRKENQKWFVFLWNRQKYSIHLLQSYVNSLVLCHSLVWKDLDHLGNLKNINYPLHRWHHLDRAGREVARIPEVSVKHVCPRGWELYTKKNQGLIISVK